MRPLFSNKGGAKDNIVLVNKDDKIISDDTEVAQTFNVFFKNVVTSLEISEQKSLLAETNNVHGGVAEAIKKFENHPSIMY